MNKARILAIDDTTSVQCTVNDARLNVRNLDMSKVNPLFGVVLLSVVGTSYAGAIFVETPSVTRVWEYSRFDDYYLSNYTAVLEPEDANTLFCASYGFPADCSVLSGHEHPGGVWYHSKGNTPLREVVMDKNHTTAQVIKYLQAWSTVSSQHTLEEGKIKECIGFAVGPGRKWGAMSLAWGAGQWVPFKGAGCANIPDVYTRSCTINNTSITLDHGVLSPSDLEGKQASVEVPVTCNGSALGTFSTYPADGRVRLDNTTYSSLSLNGRDLSQKVEVPLSEGTNTVTLMSTLHGRPASAGGTLTGNTVLIFQYF